jgi:large subunit ribosomal protein L29
MDIDKVRALTDTELFTELVTQRRSLYDLRFQLATRQLTDHSQLTQTRRSIARVLTVMTERDLDESKLPIAPAPARTPAKRATTTTTKTRTTRAKAETKTAAKSDSKAATAATATAATAKTKTAVAAAKGDEK